VAMPRWKAAKIAAKHAEKMGRLIVVDPQDHRPDGSPLLAAGQVYVTKTGQRYHVGWCQVIADKWDQGTGPVRGIFVTSIHDVGGRTECQTCVEPLTSSRLRSTPILDQRMAERDARTAAARKRINGG